jgi:hypothetical protein
MSEDNQKPDSFLSGIIKARVDGLKEAAKQGLKDMGLNAETAQKTVDGILKDKNTSYLETELDPNEPIYVVMTKGEGKNARITLWPDRLEWEKGRGISGGKVFAGLMTLGMSLALTGIRGREDAYEALPLSAVAAVSLRNGEKGKIVSVSTAGGDIDFCVSRQNAADFRQAILNQLQVRENTPQRVIIEGAAPAQVQNSDYTDQLKKLADLRDAGILTEEEFQNKKTDILGKI